VRKRAGEERGGDRGRGGTERVRGGNLRMRGEGEVSEAGR